MGSMINPTDEEYFELAKLPANIEYYRGKKAMSEEGMAIELGISLATYRRYMDEPRLMQATVLMRLCRILSITFDELFGARTAYKVVKVRQIVTRVAREDAAPPADVVR